MIILAVVHVDGLNTTYGREVLGEDTREIPSVLYLNGITALLTLNHLTPNDNFSGRTTPLTSRCCIFYLFNKYTY